MALKINRKGSPNTAPLGLTPIVSPGKEFGRISGPLLSDNLLRNGENLAFDTDVMYFDVNNKFVGINTSSPTRALDIFGDVYSTDLIVETQADIAHFTFGGTGTLDQIANYRNENIYITPDQGMDPIITFNGIGSTNKFNFVGAELTGFINQNIIFDPTGRLVFGTNVIATLVIPDEPLLSTTTAENYFRATRTSWEASELDVGSYFTNRTQFIKGTTITSVQGPFADFGQDYYIIFTSTNQLVNLNPLDTVTITISKTNLYVDGSITATGNVTFDGDITLGNDPTDVITFGAEVGSNIVPIIGGAYNLGEDITPLVWKNVYATNLITTDFNTTDANITTLNAGNIKISGNTINNNITTNDVNLIPSGTGSLNFNSFLSIKDNTISHYDSTALQFVSTGNGYFKFGGTTGWTIPVGTTTQRPTIPDIGTIRYNTTSITPEVYADVSNTTTVTVTAVTADINIGDTTIYVDTTSGYAVGDFVSCTTPGIFTSPTLVTSVVTGISINIDVAATGFLTSGNNINIQRKWIPMIGTSPVLSTDEVTEIMDIWTLILG
jgi:hypothetical protein